MLGVPDSVGISDLLCKSAHVLADFPFIRSGVPDPAYGDDAFSFEQLVKVVALFTGRVNGILTPDYNFAKLLFFSFSDTDEATAAETEETMAFPLKETDAWNLLEVVASFDDTSNRHISAHNLHRLVTFLLAIVEYRAHHRPLRSSKKFAGGYFVAGPYAQFQNAALCILRAIAPSEVPEKDDCENDEEWTAKMKALRIGFPEFERAFHTSFPYLFVPLTELFGRVLFSDTTGGSKDVKGESTFDDGYDGGEDYFSDEDSEDDTVGEKNRRKSHAEERPLDRPDFGKGRSMSYNGEKPFVPAPTHAKTLAVPPSSSSSSKPKPFQGDIFKREGRTKLVNPASMAQLSAMLGHSLYARLKRLYVGSEAGFSLRSFETRVFKWRAPTLLLVAGREIEVPVSLAGLGANVGPSGTPINARERAFNDLIPPLRRLHPQATNDNNGKGKAKKKTARKQVVFAAYIVEPWKAHAKNTFGNAESFLVQLEQVQDRFETAAVAGGKAPHYAYMTRTQPGGIGFGSAPPQGSLQSRAAGAGGFPGAARPRASSPSGAGGLGGTRFDLGSVSLTVDESLEYGVFRHVGAGGTYGRTRGARRDAEWETRFEITELEVWGSGQDEDLAEQRRRWEWEEREANYRQRVNIRNVGEERSFLEMAGIIGNHGSGGSMG